MSTLNVANITDGTDTVPTGYAINGSAKAWVNTRPVSGTPPLTDGFNVSSITDRGIGTYDFNIISAMNNANFSVSITTQYTTASGTGAFFHQENRDQRTSSRFGLNHFQNATTIDPLIANGQAFGDLA
tara:strand:- start:92 stop:475 length:384 start_codon:yes stop_codon:yes gene_type:complete